MVHAEQITAAAARMREVRLAEALEREAHALRVLCAEVDRMEPGLILDRLEGWHSPAADHYASRVGEARLAIAGARHLLAETERFVADALRAARMRAGSS